MSLSTDTVTIRGRFSAPWPALAELAGSPAPFPSTGSSFEAVMLHTYKENEAGALIQLHSVGVRQLQHRLGVPGELAAFDIIQHLHSPLPCDHVSLGVQDDESRDACDGRKTGGISQSVKWPVTGRGEKGLFLSPLALAGAQRACCLSAACAWCRNRGPNVSVLAEHCNSAGRAGS